MSLWLERVSMSTPSSPTSTGIFPTPWTASVWKIMPFSWAIWANSLIGWITPVSLLASIMLTRKVFSVISFRRSSGSIRPYSSTGRYVTINPWVSSHLQVFVTEGCSIEVVMIWFFPFGRNSKAVPLIARLLASEPLPVKTSLFGVELIR